MIEEDRVDDGKQYTKPLERRYDVCGFITTGTTGLIDQNYNEVARGVLEDVK